MTGKKSNIFHISVIEDWPPSGTASVTIWMIPTYAKATSATLSSVIDSTVSEQIGMLRSLIPKSLKTFDFFNTVSTAVITKLFSISVETSWTNADSKMIHFSMVPITFKAPTPHVQLLIQDYIKGMIQQLKERQPKPDPTWLAPIIPLRKNAEVLL